MSKNERRVTGWVGLLTVAAAFATLLSGGAAQAQESGASFAAQSGAAGLSPDKAAALQADADRLLEKLGSAPSRTLAGDFRVCTTGLGSGCTTPAVQAEGGNVWIGLYAPPAGGCSFEVIDAFNGAVVHKGSYWQYYGKTLNGLYSRYYVKLFSCPALSEAHILG